MFNNQIIDSVVLWEHRLDVENEKRNNRRGEPDYYPEPQPQSKATQSFFKRLLGSREERCPEYPCSAPEQRRGTQLG